MIVCLRSHLRIYDPTTFNFPTHKVVIHAPVQNIVMSSTPTSIGGDMANVMDQESAAAPHETSDSEPVEGIGTLLHTALNIDGTELEPSETLPVAVPTCEIDTASQEFGREVLSSETDHIRGVWDE